MTKLTRIIIEMGDPKDDIVFMATSVTVDQRAETAVVPTSGLGVERELTGRRWLHVDAEYDPLQVDPPAKPEFKPSRVAADGTMGWTERDVQRLKDRVTRVRESKQ